MTSKESQENMTFKEAKNYIQEMIEMKNPKDAEHFFSMFENIHKGNRVASDRVQEGEIILIGTLPTLVEGESYKKPYYNKFHLKGNWWVITPHEGGIAYMAVQRLFSEFGKQVNLKISDFRPENVYGSWRGIYEGWSSDYHFFRMHNTSPPTRTLNFSRNGFID